MPFVEEEEDLSFETRDTGILGVQDQILAYLDLYFREMLLH